MTLKKFNWTEHDGRSSKNVQKRKMAKQFSHNGKSKKWTTTVTKSKSALGPDIDDLNFF